MDLTKKETINCPLCSANRFKKKYEIHAWNIVKCSQCGFVYVNPRLQKHELLNIYTDNYFDNDAVGYLHYKESRELRTKNFGKWVDDAVSCFEIPADCRALDIGCAAGYCLDVFRTRGWSAYGVELNKEYALQLKQDGHKVYNAPLLEINFDERYDIITLFDVIEHLADLQDHFAKLHSILNDKGVIVMITPDYNSLQRKIFGKKWFQFKPIEHINYFNLSTLKKLAGASGLKIVQHKKAGQYSNLAFLENRLRRYGFEALLPLFRMATKISGLNRRDLYVDTASLYVVLKKK
jgi:2-polyprenyl-3-methyl-5-hydroxy-6-metoxy-1,4-benzoquinol methylase